ncbi:MAG: CBS domain-containing protein, partial [Nitrosotalea sp.]
MKLDENHHQVPEKYPQITSDKDSEMLSEVFVGHGGTTIASIMKRDVITMDHTKTAYDASTLMTEKRIGYVIITAYWKPFGIVTQRDLVRIMANLNISVKCLLLSFLASRPLIHANPT